MTLDSLFSKRFQIRWFINNYIDTFELKLKQSSSAVLAFQGVGDDDIANHVLHDPPIDGVITYISGDTQMKMFLDEDVQRLTKAE